MSALNSTSLRRPAVLAAIVAVFVALAWWQLLWSPQSQSLAAAHAGYQGASSNLAVAEQQLEHLRHLGKLAPQLAALDQSLSAAAPAGDDLDGFLLSVDTMAQASGVQLQNLSPGLPATAKGASVSTIPISMTVTGDYFGVQSFLDNLRTGARLVVIDGLAETSSTGKSASVTASINAHLLSGLAS